MNARANRYPWILIGLLWLVAFLNAADRSIIVAVMPQLRDEFGLTNTQLALLNSVFFWIYAIAAFLSGRIGDSVRRTRIILFGLTLRRIPLADIRRVGTPKREGAWLNTESWTNSWDVAHRGLVVHRLSGWRRRLLITPSHRYTFRHELRLAVAKATGTEARPEMSEESEQDED